MDTDIATRIDQASLFSSRQREGVSHLIATIDDSEDEAVTVCGAVVSARYLEHEAEFDICGECRSATSSEDAYPL
jgi:hypothetical protein